MLVFGRATGRHDVSWMLEYSTDLEFWSTLELDAREGLSIEAENGLSQSIRLPLPIEGESASRQYFRLTPESFDAVEE